MIAHTGLRRGARVLLFVAAAVIGLWAGRGADDSAGAAAAAGTTTQVSVAVGDLLGNSDSAHPQVSADGRWVAYTSMASNLARNDKNGEEDVFLHDRQTGRTTLLSRDDFHPDAWSANGRSYLTHLSDDGRYVLFSSEAPDLGASPWGVALLYDNHTGAYEMISRGLNGEGANGNSSGSDISADGRRVIFLSWATNLVPGDTTAQWADVFIYDRDTETTQRVSVGLNGAQANGHSSGRFLPDGRILITSAASNLVPGDTNGVYDVFIYDPATGLNTRISVAQGGTQADGETRGVDVSADGRYITLLSKATNLIPGNHSYGGKYNVFRLDTTDGRIERVTVPHTGAAPNGDSFGSMMSANGRYLTFTSMASNLVPGDTNGKTDIFIRDMLGGTTRLTRADGAQGNDHSYADYISADGRFIAFGVDATNLFPNDTNGVEDVLLYERATSRIDLISAPPAAPNGDSYEPAVSLGGDFVSFTSEAANLVAGDGNGYDDVFVRDQATGVIERVSVANDEQEANNYSWDSAVSDNGRYVVFSSLASNLLAGVDGNEATDVFIRDRQSGETRLISMAFNGVEGNSSSTFLDMSADARFVLFNSWATNLVPNDTNNTNDIFLHDQTTGLITRVSVGAGGVQPDRQSLGGSVSNNGRYVAFNSQATNLVTNDTNEQADVFLLDRENGQVRRVSVASDGAQANGWSNAPTAVSDDGNVVLFSSYAANLVPGDTNDVHDAFVHFVGTGETRRVSIDPDGNQGEFWATGLDMTPDGRYTVFGTLVNEELGVGGDKLGGDVYLRDLQTNETTLISGGAGGTPAGPYSWEGAISGNGRYVVFGSYATNLVIPGPPLVVGPGEPLPAGNIYIRDRSAPPTYTVSGRVTRANGAPLPNVTVGAGGGHTATTDADGNYMLVGLPAGSYTLTPARTGFTFTPASRVISVPPDAAGHDFTARAVNAASPGTVVFSSNRDGDYDIYLLDPAARDDRPVQLTNVPGDDTDPTLSPDGSQIAFTSERDGRPEVYVMEIDGSDQTRLTTSPDLSRARRPAWSPDGAALAYESDAAGNDDVYTMPLASRVPVPVTTDAADDGDPTWLPGPQPRIVFISNRVGHRQLYMVNPAAPTQVRRLTDDPATDYAPVARRIPLPVVTPTQVRVVFARVLGAQVRVMAVDVDPDGRVGEAIPIPLTDGNSLDFPLDWTLDGARLFFSSTRGGNADIYAMQPDGSNPTQLTDDPAGDGPADPEPLPRGNIVIRAVVHGPPPSSDWQFGGDLGNFTLSAAGGEMTFPDRTAGSYWLFEATVPSFTQTVACSGGAGGTGSVVLTLDPAQTVICTFTHTAEGVTPTYRLFAPAVLR